MTTKYFRAYLAALLLLIPSLSFSQVAINTESKNPFDVKLLFLPSETEGKSIIQAVFFVNTDRLLFSKSGMEFVADYTMTFKLNYGDGEEIFNESWNEKFRYEKFSETLDPNKKFLRKIEILVGSGVCNFVLDVLENETNKTFKRTGNKIVPSIWNDKVAVSDIYLTFGHDGSAERDIEIIPDETGFLIDYETSFNINLKMFSADLTPTNYSYKIFEFNSRDAAILGDSTVLQPNRNVIDMSLPVDSEVLPSGTYLFQAVMKHRNGTTRTGLKRFSFIWQNKPMDSFDINQALQQMKYILTDEEKINLNRIDDSDKITFFESYWSKRDPTSGTGVNELSEEYFKRVHETDQQFTIGDIRGWNTSRGKVYILYGTPDIKSPTPINTLDGKIITWSYFNIGKKFTFIDSSDNGNFVLLREEPLIK